MHGQGTYIYAIGDKYVGEYRDNKMHGQGTFTFANGTKFVGEWRDGLPNGQGTETSADGSVKEGIFKDGEFQRSEAQGPEQHHCTLDIRLMEHSYKLG